VSLFIYSSTLPPITFGEQLNNDLKRKREDDEDDYKESKKARLEEQTIIDEGEDIAFTKLTELAREAHELIQINTIQFSIGV
jgi:hypothetical protein